MQRLILSLVVFCICCTADVVAQMQWQRCDLPGALYIYSLVVQGGSIFAGTNTGIYRSTDGGATWTQTNNGLTGMLIGVLAIDKEGAIIAGTYQGGTNPGGIFRSTDNGNSWSERSEGLIDKSVHALGVAANGDLYAGVYRKNSSVGLYRSTDNGTTWGSATLEANVLAIAGDDAGTIYAGLALDQMSGIHRSSDNGVTWMEGDLGDVMGSVHTIVVASSGDLYAGIFDHLPSAYNVLRSIDHGATWSGIGIPNTWVNALIFDEEGTLYAGTQGGGYVNPNTGDITYYGVMRSDDNGSTWTSINEALENNFVISLAMQGSTLFAGTQGGLFRYVPSSSSAVTGTAMKGTITLNASPNPFSSITTIRLGLPEQSRVHLSVVNTLGEEVALLVDGVLESGEHNVPFSSNLPAGTYFLRGVIRDRIVTQRLVVGR